MTFRIGWPTLDLCLCSALLALVACDAPSETTSESVPNAEQATEGKAALDIGGVVERARHFIVDAEKVEPWAEHLGESQWQADDTFYRVRFADDPHVAFQPTSRAGTGAAVTWRTTHVALGDKIQSAPVRRRVENAVEYEHGRVIERWEARDGQVEQTWTLRARIDGDLLIRGAFAAETEPLVTPSGLHWASAEGPGVRVSHITVIDAKGERLSLRHELEGATASIRVPAAWLEAATYPVVVDPTWNGETGTDNPVFDDSGAAKTSVGPAATSNYLGGLVPADQVFVAWLEERSAPYKSGNGIYGVVVDETGSILSGGPIAIATGDHSHSAPAVAYVTNRWLVAWSDDQGQGRVARAAVADAASPHDFNALVLDDQGTGIGELAAGGDGTRFHVAWTADGNAKDVFLASVDGNGTLVAGPTNVTNAAGNQRTPDVAGAGGRGLVAWRNDATANLQAKGLLGASLVGSTRTLATVDDPKEPAASCYEGTGNTECRTAWHAEGGATDDVRGATIVARDAGLDTAGAEVDVAVGAGDARDADILATPVGQTVVFALVPPADDSDVAARSFLPNWTGGWTATITDEDADEIRPAVIVVDDSIGFLWNDNNGNVMYRSVDSLGQNETTPAVVNRSANAQVDPAVAFNGTHYLVSWIDRRNGNDVYATRVSTSGTVLDPAGIAIQVGGTNSEPAACSDGNRFLVAWISDGEAVKAARVLSGGGLEGVTDVRTAQTDITIDNVRCSFATNDKFLVTWEENNLGALSLKARNLKNNDATLGGIKDVVSANLGTWGLTSAGASNYVVWEDTGDQSITVRRLDKNGTPKNEMATLGTATGSIDSIDAHVAAGILVAVWTDVDGDGDVTAVRINSSLTAGLKTPLVLESGADDAREISVTAARANYFIVGWVVHDGDDRNIQGAELTIDNDQAPNGLVIENDNPFDVATADHREHNVDSAGDGAGGVLYVWGRWVPAARNQRRIIQNLGTFNRAPIADIDGDVALDEGDTATFDGSGSADLDGDALTFEWDFNYDGNDFDVEDTGDTVNHTFTDDFDGDVALRVTDTEGAVSIVTHGVVVSNVDPVANAGGNQTEDEGTQVNFAGSATDDGDDQLTYQWDFDYDGNTFDVDATGQNVSNTYADDADCGGGTCTVALRVTDDDGGSHIDTLTVTVENVAPVANAGGDQTVDEGATVSFTGSGSDVGADTLTLEWDLDGDGQFDDATGGSASFVYGDDATVTVELRVTDDEGDSHIDSLVVTVENVAPTADAGNDQTVGEGTEITLSGAGSTDPGDDTLTYDWDLDADGQYDDASGVTITHTYNDEAVVNVGLRVRDDDGGEGTDTVVVTVENIAPTVAAGDDQTVDEGVEVNFSGSATDPGNDGLTYEWDLDGDGQFDDATGETANFTYPDDAEVTVRLRVTDEDGAAGTDELTVTVNNVAPANVDAGGNRSGDEGETLSFTGSADDVAADVLTYEWDFDGDDTFDATGATVQYAYPDDADYTLKLRVTDDDGGQTETTVSVDIANVAPSDTAITAVASANEGDAVSFVGTTVDPGTGDTITYAWDFDDGNTDSGASVTHAFADEGTFDVDLNVADDDGGTDSATHQIVIANVAPSVTMVEFVGVRQGVEADYEATVTDPGNDALFYTWDVICNDLNDQNDCNDGDEYDFVTDRTGFDLDTVPMVFNVIGSYTLTLSVDDQDGGVTMDSTDVEVANEPPEVTLEGDPTTLNEGSTVNFTGTAVDPGGDDLTYAWEFGDGGTANGGLARAYTYADNGTFTALLRATDTNGESGQATVEITVNNVAPAPTVADRTLEENVPTAFTVSIVDPGTNDEHSCTWDFGDSSQPVADPNCSGVTHTYVNDGTFTLTVTVNDGDDDGVATATITVDNVPPIVLFANHNGVEGTAVDFTATAEDRSPDDTLVYTWDFGDGSDEVVTNVPAVSHTYTNNDAYSVVLTVNDGTDDTTVTRTATIANVPPTVFAGDDVTTAEGDEVVFEGTATDPGDDTLTYAWDLDGDNQFDDGNTPTVTYTYTDDATVQVRLRVNDGDDTVTDTLTVTVENVNPTVDAGNNQNVDEGDTVQFNGSATDPGDDTLTYNWDFLDGQTADDVGPSPQHVYVQEGTYRARLTVVDDDGGTGTNTVRIRVRNVAPTVVLDAVGDVNEGAEVTLTSSATDPGDDTLTFTWDFGDGNTQEGADLNEVDHTWAQEGTYTVRLTVDDGTDTTTQTRQVEVLNVAPSVNAGDDETIDEGDSITFSPMVVDPGDDTLTYAWTFGDGGSSDERAPTHRFRQQGEFTVTLSVSDQTETVTDTLVVTVNNVAPVVNAGNDATRNEGQEHQFNAVATDVGPDDVLTYHWDFGDGNTVSGRNLNRPRHTYADDQPGNQDDEYVVTLRVADADGGETTDTVVIRVNNVAPTIEAGLNQVANEGSLVVFGGTATDPGTDTLTFTWDFGDGESTSGIELTQPTHIYTQNGNYNVTLTVDDGDGGVVTDTLSVRVNNVAPVVVADEPNYAGNEGQPIELAVRTFDPGDDTLTISWNYRDGNMDEGEDLTTVTHTWADDRVYDVIVTVTDGDNGTATVVIRTVVSNVAPSIQSLPPLFGSQGVEYTYEPEAVDPGTDTLTWDLQDNPTGMTVNRTTGALSWTPNLGHVNDQPEDGWRVLLRVRDDELGTDTQEFFIDLAFTDDDEDGIADTCEELCEGDFTVGVQDDPEGDFDNDGIDNRTECGQGTSMCITNAPAAPTPIAPDDGFLQEELPVTLVVQNAIDPDEDILTYTFELFSAGDMENPVYTSDAVTEGETQTRLGVGEGDVEFEEDADYLWRARAADAHASGPWSPLQRFRLSLENNIPSVPSPVSPIGAAGQLRPVLTATNAVDPEGEALEYDFQVFIVEDQLPELIMESYGNREGEGQSTWQLEQDLEENQSYEWRVRATDARSASSRWSEMVSFLVNTQNSLPEAPVQLYPEPNGTVATQPVVLVASEAFDADGDELVYVFTLAADEGFANVIAMSAELSPDSRREITFPIDEDLSEDVPYFWRVQAFDGEGGGAVATRRFRFSTANAAPPAVTVQKPAEGESIPVLDSEFVWLNVVEPDGDAVLYDLELFRDAEMSEQIFGIEALEPADGATTTWAGPALDDNTAYWWRVRAVDATGTNGAWSPLTQFFVNVRNDPPEAPELDTPDIGDAVPSTEATTFSWFAAFDSDGDALTYTIEVFLVGDGERVFRETDLSEADDGTASWTAPEALAPGAYSWHVRAHDGTVDGPWSIDGVFSVAEVVPDDSPDAGGMPDTGEPDSTAAYPSGTPACSTPVSGGSSRSLWWAALLLGVVAARRFARR